MHTQTTLLRIRLLSAFIFLFASLLIFRLYFLQIVRSDAFSEQADRQYVQPQYTLFDRGSIFFEDKDGNLISAATLASGFTVAINPTVLAEPEIAYERLSKLLPLDHDVFLAKAEKKGDPYEEIAKRVSPDLAKKIADLHIPGVSQYKERWRYYPGHHMASHLLGFVGYGDGADKLTGRYGIERYYDDILRRDNNNPYANFFAEVFSNINKALVYKGAKTEGDLVLFIEPNVQSFLEDRLREIVGKWKAVQVGGMIIDPNNGAVFALAAYPDFDPNSFNTESNAAVFSNPLVESVFEMGSIVKPLTLAAGLDSGSITADTTYYDSGSVNIEGTIISNYDKKGRGKVNMQEVLNKSLNTGAVFVEQQMGNEVFARYFIDFGLGEETGIDLPNETMGLVENLESPRDIEHATAAFGQGIAMTPVITVRALSALANGGRLITPRIVKKIDYALGFSKHPSPPPDKQVISQAASEEITRMLVAVVDEALLGGKVKMDRYSIAAKTGTAQIAKEDGGGYYNDRFFHSFFGYFPAYEPRFLVFLYAMEPQGARYASQTLTYPFMDITKFLLNYYEIPPDR
jgi:cell division protein FtsI/penicillin-binding protein 2